MSGGCWKVVGRSAEFDAIPGGGRLDLARPREGLEWSRGRCSLLRTHVPGLSDPVPESMLVDVYVREDDLVVTYGPTPDSQLHTQVYWRRVAQGSLVGLHWVFSVWTPRLDARPVIHLGHRWGDTIPWLASALVEGQAGSAELPGFHELRAEMTQERSGTVARLSASSLLLARSTTDANAPSLVLMAYPTDVVRGSVSSAEATPRAVEYDLLEEHLEKGVIRRAQAMVWWVPREGDAQLARELYRQFLDAPPPLTT
jgi:hypothetical protein